MLEADDLDISGDVEGIALGLEIKDLVVVVIQGGDSGYGDRREVAEGPRGLLGRRHVDEAEGSWTERRAVFKC